LAESGGKDVSDDDFVNLVNGDFGFFQQSFQDLNTEFGR
jgi:hypothetical protein